MNSIEMHMILKEHLRWLNKVAYIEVLNNYPSGYNRRVWMNKLNKSIAAVETKLYELNRTALIQFEVDNETIGSQRALIYDPNVTGCTI